MALGTLIELSAFAIQCLQRDAMHIMCTYVYCVLVDSDSDLGRRSGRRELSYNVPQKHFGGGPYEGGSEFLNIK